MYKNGFVVSIKNNENEVLRDDGYRVNLPWYEEYKILLKNKHGRKANVDVTIDGRDAVKGLILKPWQSIDLERFVKGDLDKGRKFQFVPADDSRIKDLKDSGELGIIEVTFKLEERNFLRYTNCIWPNSFKNLNSTKLDSTGGTITGRGRYARAGGQSVCRSASIQTCSLSTGGTAEGSRSEQKFNYVNGFVTEDESTTIRLRLIPVEENTPNTVKETKSKYCIHCGNKLPTTANFCSNCGEKV